MVFNLAENCSEVSIGDNIFGQKPDKVGKRPIKKGLSPKSVDFQSAKLFFLPDYLPPNAAFHPIAGGRGKLHYTPTSPANRG
jgi:hypothetical protein